MYHDSRFNGWIENEELIVGLEQLDNKTIKNKNKIIKKIIMKKYFEDNMWKFTFMLIIIGMIFFIGRLSEKKYLTKEQQFDVLEGKNTEKIIDYKGFKIHQLIYAASDTTKNDSSFGVVTNVMYINCSNQCVPYISEIRTWYKGEVIEYSKNEMIKVKRMIDKVIDKKD